MRLIIGGKNQGKLHYAQEKYGPLQVTEGSECPLELGQPAEILHDLHLLVARSMEQGLPADAVVEGFVGPKTIVICDEVGCGVVPVEKDARQWREATGRICCQLASRAQTVERVICGIPQVIKEE